jgi:hypothetical protein
MADGRGSLFQVDADGPEAGPWRDLAIVLGQPGLNAAALFQTGDLVLSGQAPAAPFDALAYIASHDDLIGAFGDDRLAGERHYLTHGYAEGRTVTFDGLQYVASHHDLITAIGADVAAGTGHYVRTGHGENRPRDQFDEVQYVANYTDLQAAFGDDYEAATAHFITNGYAELRTDKPLAAEADFIV